MYFIFYDRLVKLSTCCLIENTTLVKLINYITLLLFYEGTDKQHFPLTSLLSFLMYHFPFIEHEYSHTYVIADRYLICGIVSFS